MTTVGIIAEQIQRLTKRMSGSDDSNKRVVDRREIKALIVQVANALLKPRAMAAMKMGDISTPPCNLISYDLIPVTSVSGRSTAVIPVYPISLPRDLGVWSVVPKLSGIDMAPYIPITASDWDLLRSYDEGLLENQTGYYVENQNIYLTSAVPANWLTGTPYTIGQVVTSGGFQWTSLTNHTDAIAPVEGAIWNQVFVKMKLLVADISTLTDASPLPVTAEMEEDIIKEVLAVLKAVIIPVQPNTTNEEKN
jgi:hypothetical protein